MSTLTLISYFELINSVENFKFDLIEYLYNYEVIHNNRNHKNRNRTDKPLNIRWPALPIKVLGVYFGYDRELCKKRNFGDKIDKAKQIINM